jgi:hypothetical protein
MNQQCSTCKYWNARSRIMPQQVTPGSSYPLPQQPGYCTLNAPSASSTFKWPVTAATDFCGQYTSAAPTAPSAGA